MNEICCECNQVNCNCNISIRQDHINNSKSNVLKDSTCKSESLITFLNVQHFFPKINEIKGHLSNNNAPCILGLCETFLSSSISDNMLLIDNYSFERKDREGKKGGGIIVYLADNVSYKRRHDIEVNEIESIWLEISPAKCKPFLLNFIYRPPNSKQNWIDLYDTQLNIADCLNTEFFIFGDFNINCIMNDGLISFSNEKWSDIVNKFGLIQLITAPTRVTKNSSTIIDHIYTNNTRHVVRAFTSSLALSDHYPVCLLRSMNFHISKDSKHTVIKYRSFKKFNENNFRSDLLCSGLENVETITDPNAALYLFYNILNGVLSKHAPIKEKRIKRTHQPGWFNNNIKQLINERDRLKRNGDYKKYKMHRNLVSCRIKKSKRDFYNNAIKENKDSKYLWKHIKDISYMNNNKNSGLPPRLKSKDGYVEGSLNISNELNSHFVNISQIVDKLEFHEKNFSALKSRLDSELYGHEFDITYITPFEVKKIIDKLDIRKSTGLDGIGPTILKHCGDTITTCIASIINNSICSGIFPDTLKTASVMPIFKSGMKDLADNYRPISILPTISKIYERHIASQLQDYFSTTKIIHKTQSGFRKQHSCQTSLTRLIDTWIKDIDNGNLVGTVFLDLKKAFDLVDHKILLYKLKLYHFSPKSISLFTSYLSKRKQQVKVGNVKSEFMEIKSGVPQGSILGPLLFLIYINNIAYLCPDLNIDLYADDSTLFKSDTELSRVESHLQSNLNCISEWCTYNNMALHPQKTKCMVIGSKQKLRGDNHLTLKVNDCILENVNSQKVLGVFIDCNLSWHTHIDFVCKNLNNKISLLKHILYYLTDDMKLMFYNAYLVPIFDYCCTIWGKSNKSYINKVNNLQKERLDLF